MKTISTLKTTILVALTICLFNTANSQDARLNTSTVIAAKATQEISFTATTTNNKADLKWTAATDMKVDHFMVERSSDGVNFSDAALVFAFEEATTLPYKYAEKLHTDATVVYYRICMIGKDGKAVYSTVQTINASTSKN
jgi:hypothetical protein